MDEVKERIDDAIVVEIQAAGKPVKQRLVSSGAEGRQIALIVQEMGLPRSIIIAVKNGQPVPETEYALPGETVRLISVVSGG